MTNIRYFVNTHNCEFHFTEIDESTVGGIIEKLPFHLVAGLTTSHLDQSNLTKKV